jgi:uncharacterized membrane protein (DUF2068 family)
MLIGGFKFACGLLLVALGVGLFRHAHADPAEEAAHLVAALKLDPDNAYIHSAITRLTNISPGQLRAIGAGTFLYALLYLVEGGGLLLRKHWAEYLTVIATGIFIPLEIYEVIQRVSPIRIALLVVNLAIVAYLIYQLMRKEREAPSVPSGPTPPVT